MLFFFFSFPFLFLIPNNWSLLCSTIFVQLDGGIQKAADVRAEQGIPEDNSR